jgi:hypothetical protein
VNTVAAAAVAIAATAVDEAAVAVVGASTAGNPLLRFLCSDFRRGIRKSPAPFGFS